VPRLLAILMLCLAAALPAWRGPAAAHGAAAAPDAGIPSPAHEGCACAGSCGMDCCPCAAPADPPPADTDHRTPAPRETRPVVLDMPRPAGALALGLIATPPRGPITAARPASYSYDSIQSYLCIWRS
jgi:hypothetical protein